MEKVRYELVKQDLKYLCTEKFGKEKFLVKHSCDPIFVNIFEVDKENLGWAKLKLYYSDGTIVEGWTWHMVMNRPVKILGFDELFDGRFNQ